MTQKNYHIGVLQDLKSAIRKAWGLDAEIEKEEICNALNAAIKALEQEPTIKNNAPIYCDRNICLKNEYNNIGCEDCEVTKSQEPTTKNDLGVDCISRQAVIDSLYDWSNHSMTDAETWHLRQVIGDIKSMPSVTPQEPKTGHWIVDGSVDCYLDKARCHCSECGKKKNFPADYNHIKQELSISYKYPELIDNYCPNCGAKMVEPQESEEQMIDKIILDVTCGSRSIWFQKNEPHTIFCDKRDEEWEGDFGKAVRKDGTKKHRKLAIHPDMICDFTNLPFDDNTFRLVIFDPPHIENLGENSWTRKAYGSLDGDWKQMLHDGFKECMRVLVVGGVLIFKWSDVSVSTREILNIFGQEALFGHRSGKKANTHWMCFMKFDTPAESERT